MTPEREKDIRERDRLRKALDDPYIRYQDAVVQTLVYISNNVLEPEHAEQIQAEVDGLLAQLGVK